MKEWVQVPGYDAVCLHWNSWFARALKPGGINNCVTLSRSHIFISRDWIQRDGFAHEYGHTRQAKARGWRYLPWVLWGYLTHGYAGSPAEVDADTFMVAHRQDFPVFLRAAP